MSEDNQKLVSDYWVGKSNLIEAVDDMYNLTTHRCGIQKHKTEIKSLEDMDLINKDTTLLDLSCGNGRLCRHFHDKVKKLVGTDIGPGFVDNLNKWKKENETKNSEFFVLDLLEKDFHTKFKDEFSLIIFFGTSQCILEDENMQNVFDSLYNLTSKGGHLLLKQTTSIVKDDVKIDTVLKGEAERYLVVYRTVYKMINMAMKSGFAEVKVMDVYTPENLGEDVYNKVECWTNTKQKYFLFRKV